MSGYFLHIDTQNENYEVPKAVYVKFLQQEVEIEYLRIALHNACVDIGHAIENFDPMGLDLLYVENAKKELTRKVSE